jgi:hypothetical protein
MQVAVSRKEGQSRDIASFVQRMTYDACDSGFVVASLSHSPPSASERLIELFFKGCISVSVDGDGVVTRARSADNCILAFTEVKHGVCYGITYFEGFEELA